MTTFATLRTRLYNRCGITTASTAEQDLANESLNAAIAYHSANLPPQLRQVFSGYSLADLSTTVSTHTANTSTLVVASATDVRPGDILKDTPSAKSYLIRTVASTTLDVGIPIVLSLAGNAVTIVRRSLALPTAGTVMEVYQVDGNRPLRYDPLVSPRAQFETGTAQYFTQQFSETGEASYLSLFPAPSSAVQFLVVQFPGFAEDATVYMSEALINAILATAYAFRMAMSGPIGYLGAQRVAEQLEALRSMSSGSHGVIQKP